MLAFELCIHVRAGAHESRRNGGYMNIIARQLRSNRIGETGQRKLTGAVRSQMRHPDLAAN